MFDQTQLCPTWFVLTVNYKVSISAQSSEFDQKVMIKRTLPWAIRWPPQFGMIKIVYFRYLS